MSRRIVDVMVSGDGVTLWLEGADSQSDYFPAIHRTPQRNALRYLAEDGTAEGCTVHTVNSRDFDREDGPDEKRAQRFARKAGLPYKPQIHFPTRATSMEAAADAATVRGAVVIFGGPDWVHVGENMTRAETTYRATLEPNGRQIVALPWVEAVAS